jgi:hypothetical protein
LFGEGGVLVERQARGASAAATVIVLASNARRSLA